ncbi:hypothetical protein [Alcaligenes sp. SDU_A2]|uniref:hypothetical protein n=1 Tax=Alcaligenes sp. SDU_A2 TaxID=3136634 RepID=UPI003120464B
MDGWLAALPCFSGATDMSVSPMLPADFVLAEKYFQSFSQHAFRVGNDIDEKEKYLLSPTCCYPVFYNLSGKKLHKDTLLSNKCFCFRCEKYYAPGERQISFLMREYIFLSADLAVVQAWIEDVKQQVAGLIRQIGLDVELEKATDPFFNANDFRQKFQENQNLKSEFIVDGLACGSINLHLKAFSLSCDIKSSDGGDLYSACFGMGYNRIYSKYESRLAQAVA